jgi:hypothetical protein
MLFIGEEKYSKIKPYCEARANMSDVNLDIECSEVMFKKFDDNVVILFALKKANSIYKPESVTPNQLLALTLHTKTYETWTKDNPKTPTEPSELELLLIDVILNKKIVEFDKLYSGTICFNSMPSVVSAVKAMEKYDIFIKVEPKEGEAEFLKEAVQSTNGYGKGGYAKGQTEAEKLNDRTKWLMKHCGQPEDTLIKDFDPTKVEAVIAIASIIFL